MSRNNTLAIVQLQPFLSVFFTLPCSIVLDLNFQVLDSAQSLVQHLFPSLVACAVTLLKSSASHTNISLFDLYLRISLKHL